MISDRDYPRDVGRRAFALVVVIGPACLAACSSGTSADRSPTSIATTRATTVPGVTTPAPTTGARSRGPMGTPPIDASHGYKLSGKGPMPFIGPCSKLPLDPWYLHWSFACQGPLPPNSPRFGIARWVGPGGPPAPIGVSTSALSGSGVVASSACSGEVFGFYLGAPGNCSWSIAMTTQD